MQEDMNERMQNSLMAKQAMAGNPDTDMDRDNGSPSLDNNQDPQQAQAIDADGDTDASSEDEAKLVMAATDILYSKEARENNLAFLSEGKPVVSIPKLTAQLVAMVDEKSGGNAPEDIILPAAIDVLDEVREFGAKAGIRYDDSEAEDAQSVLVQELMQTYGVTREHVQEFVNHSQVKGVLESIAQGG